MTLYKKFQQFCCSLLVTIIISTPLHATEAELQQILLPFKNISYIHFTYSEIRQSVFFKKKQFSSGEIIFKRPDVVVKQVLKPFIKKYEINKSLVTISYTEKTTSKKHLKTLNLDNYPQLQQFVSLMKAILSSDVRFLSDNFSCEIQKQNNIWIIKLSKISATDAFNAEQTPIKKIIITGRDSQLLSIKTIGFGGESSELKLEHIITKSVYPDAQN